MKSLLAVTTFNKAVIPDTSANMTASTSGTTASTADTTGIQTPVAVESENNSLALVKVEQESERHSVHPMITRSYRQISGRRPLHSPLTKKSHGSSNVTPKKRTPKNGVSKKYIPKGRARVTPVTPKTPKAKKTPKQTPRVGSRSTGTCSPEQCNHMPGPVARRRSLYTGSLKGAEKRKV